MLRERTNPSDPQVAALAALGWVLTDPERADRLLALTGLTPEGLRARAADPALLAAVLGFVCAHEPDLVACADATGTTPQALADAERALSA